MKLTEQDFPIRTDGRRVISFTGRELLSLRTPIKAANFAGRMNAMDRRLLIR